MALNRLGWILLLCGAGQASDWMRFRGPNGSGVADAKNLPQEIGPSSNVIWKAAVPPGHSSPILVGDRIFLTAAEGGKRVDAGRDKWVDEGGRLFTYAVHRANGEILWRQQVPRPRMERYQAANSPASPSAVSDGNSVFVFFGDFGLISYTLDGKERWRHPLGPFNNVNGHGSSPVVYGDNVILVCDSDTDSFLLAVDKHTGKVAWRTERPEVTRSYVTPAVYDPGDGPAQLIVPGAYHLHGYNAVTGEKLWFLRGLSWQPKSTPVVAGGLVYAHWWEAGGEAEGPAPETPPFRELLVKFDANKDGRIAKDELAADARLQRGFENTDLANDGFWDEQDWENSRARRASKNALLALRPKGTGELAESSIVWRMQKFLPNVPSPLVYEGVLYLVKDGGILTAVDARTGEILKQGRLPGALDTYYASPVAADGKVYLISQQGKATVLKAGPQWEVLHSADFEEEAYATPAIADGRIYLRTKRTLYCFGKK